MLHVDNEEIEIYDGILQTVLKDLVATFFILLALW